MFWTDWLPTVFCFTRKSIRWGKNVNESTAKIVSLTQEIQFRLQTVIFCFFCSENQKYLRFRSQLTVKRKTLNSFLLSCHYSELFDSLQTVYKSLLFGAYRWRNFVLEMVEILIFKTDPRDLQLKKNSRNHCFRDNLKEISTAFVAFRNMSRRKYGG